MTDVEKLHESMRAGAGKGATKSTGEPDASQYNGEGSGERWQKRWGWFGGERGAARAAGAPGRTLPLLLYC